MLFNTLGLSMNYVLEPSSYLCPQDQNDLTDEVERKALAKPVLVLPDMWAKEVGRRDSAGLLRSLWRRGRHDPSGPFGFTVPCPGRADVNPKVDPHRQPFQGVVREA